MTAVFLVISQAGKAAEKCGQSRFWGVLYRSATHPRILALLPVLACSSPRQRRTEHRNSGNNQHSQCHRKPTIPGTVGNRSQIVRRHSIGWASPVITCACHLKTAPGRGRGARYRDVMACGPKSTQEVALRSHTRPLFVSNKNTRAGTLEVEVNTGVVWYRA